MFWLRQRYAKLRMPAFLRGELPLHLRRYVARQVHEDDSVYTDYQAQRHIADELERRLPTFGKPQPDALRRVWSHVQAEVATPSAAKQAFTLPRFRMRYGLIACVLALALMLPLLVDGYTISASVPQQPAPKVLRLTPTPDSATDTAAADAVPIKPTVVAYVELTEPGRDRWHKLPHNTPAP